MGNPRWWLLAVVAVAIAIGAGFIPDLYNKPDLVCEASFTTDSKGGNKVGFIQLDKDNAAFLHIVPKNIGKASGGEFSVRRHIMVEYVKYGTWNSANGYVIPAPGVSKSFESEEFQTISGLSSNGGFTNLVFSLNVWPWKQVVFPDYLLVSLKAYVSINDPAKVKEETTANDSCVATLQIFYPKGTWDHQPQL